MQPLINNYSLTALPNNLPQFQTFHSYDFDQEANFSISITLKDSDFIETNNINGKHIESLSQISELESNWDGEDAIRPPQSVIGLAKAIILLTGSIGQEIYNIAPGPNGEILILFINNNKSLEVLIYPDKLLYVKFPEKGNPFQGEFTLDLLLTDLISWLNS